MEHFGFLSELTISDRLRLDKLSLLQKLPKARTVIISIISSNEKKRQKKKKLENNTA